ncbi:DciA family protein [Candidatus Margulisiibacteriota bacterium]
MTEKLARILECMEIGAGKAIQICGLLSLWPKVVDERVGRNTEALKIRNNVLYVGTSSSAWAQELTFLKKGFMEKFNEAAGRTAIKDIRFKAGG